MEKQMVKTGDFFTIDAFHAHRKIGQMAMPSTNRTKPEVKGIYDFLWIFLFVYKMDDFLKMFRSEGREGGHFLWDCSHITSAKNNYFVELCGDKRFRTF